MYRIVYSNFGEVNKILGVASEGWQNKEMAQSVADDFKEEYPNYEFWLQEKEGDTWYSI